MDHNSVLHQNCQKYGPHVDFKNIANGRVVLFLGPDNDKQNRVLLLIVFIQKAIAYSYVNKIQIYKHESCSIQCIEPCEKKEKKLKINWYLLVIGFQSWSPQILSFNHPKYIH